MSEQVRVTYAQKNYWIYFRKENWNPGVKKEMCLMLHFINLQLETWNPEDTSLFIKKQKYNYIEVIKKYEITETKTRNFFINRHANITLLQMQKMAKDVNLEEFFIPADETVDDKFYPEQGDIVLHSGKKMLVLSKYDVNKKYSFFVGIDLVDGAADGIEVVGEKDSYVGLVQTVFSYTYSRKCPVVIDKINSGNPFEEILAKFDQIF